MSTSIAETATEADSRGGESKAPSDGREEIVDATLASDELFHLLQSERRRRAIQYLLAADQETVSMRDVAEAVAAEEYDTTVPALGSEDRQRVYITLYQSHLPQLDRAGVITYDQSRGHVTPTPLIERFEPYLRTSPEDEDGPESWVLVAIASSGLGAVTTLALLEVVGVFATFGVVLAVMAAVLAIGVTTYSL